MGCDKESDFLSVFGVVEFCNPECKFCQRHTALNSTAGIYNLLCPEGEVVHKMRIVDVLPSREITASKHSVAEVSHTERCSDVGKSLRLGSFHSELRSFNGSLECLDALALLVSQ